MSLNDRTVVVIGGSSGMGLATARRAAEAGASVTITSTSAEKLAAALAALPGGSSGAVVDLHEPTSIDALFDRIESIDHLVITAGDAAAPRPLSTTAVDELRQLFEVRFWGAVTAIQRATGRMSPRGSITLTSGTIAVRPVAGSAVAAAGASAIEGLVRGLAVELAPIRVNAIRPGVIRTPMWDAYPEPQRDRMLDALAHRTLTGTIGSVDHIAAAQLHIIENDFLTGTVMTVDGGALLGSA